MRAIIAVAMALLLVQAYGPLPFERISVALSVGTEWASKSIATGLSWFLSIIIMDAVAANRYLVMDDAGCTKSQVATDVDCWASVSGGVGGAGVPGVLDNAILDGSSGVGTVTQNAALSVAAYSDIAGIGSFAGVWDTAGYTLTSSGACTFTGTFYARTSTITCVDFDSTGTSPYYGFQTSTLVMSATGTLKTVAGGGLTDTLWNLIINDGVTVTLLSGIGIGGILTFSTSTSGGFGVPAAQRSIGLNGRTANPLVLNVGSNSAWCGDSALNLLVYIPTNQASYNVLGATYKCTLYVENGQSGSVTATPTDDIVVKYAMVISPKASSEVVNLAMGAYNLTVQGTVLQLGGGGSSGDAGWESSLQFTTGALNSTTVHVHNQGAYIKWGSSQTHVISAQYTDRSTSASWDAGTGNVSFSGTGSLHIFGSNLPVYEFYDVYVTDPDTVSGSTFTAGGNLSMAGTLRVVDAAGGSSLLMRYLGVQYWIRADAVIVQLTSNLNIVNGTITTRAWTVTGNGFVFYCRTSPSGCSSTAKVSLYGTGNVVTSAIVAYGDFWNLEVQVGAVSSFLGPTYVGNKVWVNGTVLATGTNGPLQGFDALMFNINTPLYIGAFGDMSRSGFFVYLNSGPSTTFYVTGGTYEDLQVAAKANDIVYQLGDIYTTARSGWTPSYQAGEAIFRTNDNNQYATFTYYTQNYILSVAGVFFLGDFAGESVDFYAGSSSIIVLQGMNPRENSTVYLQTSTVVVYPLGVYSPVAFYMVGYSTVYGNSSVVIIHGKLRLWPAASNAVKLYGQSSSWSVLSDSGTVSSFGSPGDVEIGMAGQFIDFGSSEWFVKGNWTGASISASWVAGGRITFNGATAQYIGGTGTNNKFGIVILSGGDAKTFLANFSTGDVTLAAGTIWYISSGVTYTLAPGSHLDINGDIIWDYMTLYSPVPGVTMGVAITSTTITGATVSNVTLTENGVTVCNGIDGGGNGGPWHWSDCSGQATPKPPPVFNITSQPNYGTLALQIGSIIMVGLIAYIFLRRDES